MSSAHAERVARYYDENTQPFYLRYWDDEDIHFGLFAAEGDAAPGRGLKGALKAMTLAIAAPARIAPGEDVLDAGCGIGGAAIDVARLYGCRVTGLTISSLQVDLARQRAKEAGLDGSVRFARADCSHRIPLPDDSLDVVISVEAACHFADKARFLRECARVLRPGGRIAASDWMRGEACSVDAEREHIAPVCDAWRLAGLEPLAGWRRLLEGAGFRVRELVDLSTEVLENAGILERAALELMLENARAAEPKPQSELWLRQYGSLARAWRAGHFTIGRMLASC